METCPICDREAIDTDALWRHVFRAHLPEANTAFGDRRCFCGMHVTGGNWLQVHIEHDNETTLTAHYIECNLGLP